MATREEILKKAREAQAVFLKYAREYKHGREHQIKWFRMAITAGVDYENPPEGFDNINPGTLRALTIDEIKYHYKENNGNRRWTYALNWYRDYTSAEENRQKEYKKSVPTLEELRAKEPPDPNEWLAAGRSEEDYKAEYGIEAWSVRS